MGDAMGSGRTLLAAADLLGNRYGDNDAQRAALQVMSIHRQAPERGWLTELNMS